MHVLCASASVSLKLSGINIKCLPATRGACSTFTEVDVCDDPALVLGFLLRLWVCCMVDLGSVDVVEMQVTSSMWTTWLAFAAAYMTWENH